MDKISELEKITEEALNCGDAEKRKMQLSALAVLQESAAKMRAIKDAKRREDGVVEVSEEAFDSFVNYSFASCYMIATSATYRNSSFAETSIKAGKKIVKAKIPGIMERFLKEYNKKKQ